MDELRALDLETKKERKISRTGKVLLGVTGGIFSGICAITIPFVSPALRRVCLPYVPATSRQVDNVMQLLKGRSGAVVDLGSGDGRIVSKIKLTISEKVTVKICVNMVIFVTECSER